MDPQTEFLKSLLGLAGSSRAWHRGGEGRLPTAPGAGLLSSALGGSLPGKTGRALTPLGAPPCDTPVSTCSNPLRKGD